MKLINNGVVYELTNKTQIDAFIRAGWLVKEDEPETQIAAESGEPEERPKRGRRSQAQQDEPVIAE